MMSNLGWEFASERNLLPLFAFYFSTFLSINVDCSIVHVINAEFPHIAETAFLKVLTSIDVEPKRNWIKMICLLIIPSKRGVISTTVGDFSTHRKQLVPSCGEALWLCLMHRQIGSWVMCGIHFMLMISSFSGLCVRNIGRHLF
jgi:hypothetical protein